jgi:hypothetical protein
MSHVSSFDASIIGQILVCHMAYGHNICHVAYGHNIFHVTYGHHICHVAYGYNICLAYHMYLPTYLPSYNLHSYI